MSAEDKKAVIGRLVGKHRLAAEHAAALVEEAQRRYGEEVRDRRDLLQYSLLIFRRGG
jgi:hypothetical protein